MSKRPTKADWDELERKLANAIAATEGMDAASVSEQYHMELGRDIKTGRESVAELGRSARAYESLVDMMLATINDLDLDYSEQLEDISAAIEAFIDSGIARMERGK